MTGNVIENTIRRVTIFAFLGAVVYGAWNLTSEPRDVFADEAQDRLTQRVEQYITLRKKDDQVAIYDMHDPAQREIKDLKTFLDFHGRGVLKVIDMKWDEPRIDDVQRTAKVSLHMELELQRDKLPPPFDTLEEEHPEHLRRPGEEELDWVWREGDWYLRMDRTFVTGMTADGRKIKAFGE